MNRAEFKPTREYAKLTPGDTIAIMCELKEVSQAEVARRARMNASHLSAIIHGRRPLGMALARRIAQALDISLSYLIEEGQAYTQRRKNVHSIVRRLKRQVHRARVKGKPIGEVTERHILRDLDELNSAL